MGWWDGALMTWRGLRWWGRDGVLKVLYALGGSAELAWAAAKHGGAVYILHLLLPTTGPLPPPCHLTRMRGWR